MTDLSKARIEMMVVALMGLALISFILVMAIRDNPSTVAVVIIIAAGMIFITPVAVWETRWRLRATQVAMVTAIALVIPSFVVVGPIFIVPAALLAADAFSRLTKRHFADRRDPAERPSSF